MASWRYASRNCPLFSRTTYSSPTQTRLTQPALGRKRPVAGRPAATSVLSSAGSRSGSSTDGVDRLIAGAPQTATKNERSDRNRTERSTFLGRRVCSSYWMRRGSPTRCHFNRRSLSGVGSSVSAWKSGRAGIEAAAGVHRRVHRRVDRDRGRVRRSRCEASRSEDRITDPLGIANPGGARCWTLGRVRNSVSVASNGNGAAA